MKRQIATQAPFESFDLASLIVSRQQLRTPYLSFLNVPSLSMGLYVLPPNGSDHQSRHARDEVYYIISGLARLRVGPDDLRVKRGSVVFVKADTDHQFHSIEEELRVLVFFSAERSD